MVVPRTISCGNSGIAESAATAPSPRGGFELLHSSSSDSSEGSADSTPSTTTSTDGDDEISSTSRQQMDYLYEEAEQNTTQYCIVDTRERNAVSENGHHHSIALPAANEKKNIPLLLISAIAITSSVVVASTGFALQQHAKRPALSNDKPYGRPRRKRGAPIVRRDNLRLPVEIVLAATVLGNDDESSITLFALPELLGLDLEVEAYSTPDFGGLDLWSGDSTMGLAQRQLQKHDDRYLDWYREDLMKDFFQDDDEEVMWTYGDAYRHPLKACNVPEVVYTPKPTCNPFHEFSLGEELMWTAIHDNGIAAGVHFLGQGYYRDAWSMPASIDGNIVAVLKQTRFERTLNRNRMQEVQTEALVMEELTSSPRISSIYGHCAFSVAVEAAAYDMEDSVMPLVQGLQDKRGHISQSLLDQLSIQDAHPLNNFTAPEKLDILLQMAESMADAHGLPTGPVVSGDVAVDQWLRSSDGQRIVLNDFDNAVFMSYNLTSQQYCPYRSGPVGGFKTPEEHRVDFLDESVDMWKMGSLIFTVLTGLKPYYDAETTDEIWARIDAGELPYLDPRYETRSWIEGRLVDIMRRCHRFHPADRATIFQVVAHLRETQRLYNEQQPSPGEHQPGHQRRLRQRYSS